MQENYLIHIEGVAVTDGRVGVDLFYETYKESSLNWKNEVNVYIYD